MILFSASQEFLNSMLRILLSILAKIYVQCFPSIVTYTAKKLRNETIPLMTYHVPFCLFVCTVYFSGWQRRGEGVVRSQNSASRTHARTQMIYLHKLIFIFTIMMFLCLIIPGGTGDAGQQKRGVD